MPERTYIRHLAERSLWDAAGDRGAYRMSTRDRAPEQEGFIRCSMRAQPPSARPLLYGSSGGPEDLVVLVVDPVRLAVPVKCEAPEAGTETFPHMYGLIPVDAVDAVVQMEPWR